MDQTLSTYYRHRASEYDEVYEKPARVTSHGSLRSSESSPLRVAFSKSLPVPAFGRCVQQRAPRRFLQRTSLRNHSAIARSRHYSGAVAFAHCDAFALDKLPGDFDASLACFWLSHLNRSDMERFAVHLVSRLEPRSRVLFADNRFVEGSSSPITRTDADGNTYQRRTLHDGETFEVLKNFPNAMELLSLGETVGVDVEVTELAYYWTLTFTTSE
jgi:hypothetical protein